VRTKIDLAAALAAVDEPSTQALTLAELVRAYSLATLDASDNLLRFCGPVAHEQLITALVQLRTTFVQPRRRCPL
jgi:hypothetical protein